MTTLGKILCQAGIITGEVLLTTGVSYATNTVIDMYAHPDLKDCKTDEEKEKKIESFNKTMGVIKPLIGVVEGALISAGCNVAIDAVKNSRNKTAETVDTAEESTEEAALMGSYLISF